MKQWLNDFKCRHGYHSWGKRLKSEPFTLPPQIFPYSPIVEAFREKHLEIRVRVWPVWVCNNCGVEKDALSTK